MEPSFTNQIRVIDLAPKVSALGYVYFYIKAYILKSVLLTASSNNLVSRKYYIRVPLALIIILHDTLIAQHRWI